MAFCVLAFGIPDAEANRNLLPAMAPAIAA
jgi:hypothetical protein